MDLMLEAAMARLSKAKAENPAASADEQERETFNWLGRQLGGLNGKMSEASQRRAKTQLQAQSAVYEMKLSNQRTASSLALQEKALEMTAAFNSKFEQRVKDIRGEARPMPAR